MLADRIRAMVASAPSRRVLVGIAGRPGAGKSTLATAIARRLGRVAAVVPMDGFHIADAVLKRLGLIDRKGVPETFDPYGLATLLARLRREPGPLYAPGFERTLEQPLAQAVMITPDQQVVITEGNYLLLDTPAWRSVRDQLDEVWWLDSDEQLRRRWLRQRHVRYGKSPAHADAWMTSVDEPNAALVAPTAELADLVLTLPE